MLCFPMDAVNDAPSSAHLGSDRIDVVNDIPSTAEGRIDSWKLSKHDLRDHAVEYSGRMV